MNRPWLSKVVVDSKWNKSGTLTEQWRWHWWLCANWNFIGGFCANMKKARSSRKASLALGSSQLSYWKGATVRDVLMKEVGPAWRSFRRAYFNRRNGARLRFYFNHAYGVSMEDLENERSSIWRSDLWFVPFWWRIKKQRRFIQKELVNGRMTRTLRHVNIEWASKVPLGMPDFSRLCPDQRKRQQRLVDAAYAWVVLPNLQSASGPTLTKVSTIVGRWVRSRSSNRSFYCRAVEWHREWFVFVDGK